MLRVTGADLGRWSSRDFLRGRSKRAGAVHTRHTHGRQGRYKRLSDITASVRDGRRHAGNHMQGGLGIKLGGGLFGLRIPRQHQLSHMTREDFELEVYGHPNITNPYREHLAEHPDLKSVMMNAALTMRLVVLLPRAPRRLAAPVPAPWLAVVQDVRAALAALTSADGSAAVDDVEVHLCTLETSVVCTAAQGTGRTTSADVHARTAGAPDGATDLETGAAALYRAHCLLGQRLQPVTPAAVDAATTSSSSHTAAAPASPRPQRRRRPAAFMSAALRAPSPTTCGVATPGAAPRALESAAVATRSAPSFTSAVLAQLLKEGGATVQRPTTESGTDVRDGAGTPQRTTTPWKGSECTAPAPAPTGKGVAALVRECSATAQPLLRLCLRPHWRPSTSLSRSIGTAPEHRDGVAASAPPPPSRRVLKEDIDPNSETGVWRLAQTPLADLLRWHYAAQDPRAHSHDALPHHRRRLPLLLLVDGSTTRVARSEGDTGAARTAASANATAAAVPTLMPRRLSRELEAAGFKMIAEASLQEAAVSLQKWSPGRQWEQYRNGHTAPVRSGGASEAAAATAATASAAAPVA